MKRVDTSYTAPIKRLHFNSSQESSDSDVGVNSQNAEASQQEEDPDPSFHAWLKRIQDPKPIEDSLEISLGYQDDGQRIKLLHEAISNSKFKVLSFSGLSFTPEDGLSIFQTCLANSYVYEINFPIWNIIFSPGQKPLMYLEQHLPSMADAYNKKELTAFESFKALNKTGFKIKSVKAGKVVTREYRFDEQILDNLLAPCFSIKKVCFKPSAQI